MPQRTSRREFLALAGAGAAALIVGCDDDEQRITSTGATATAAVPDRGTPQPRDGVTGPPQPAAARATPTSSPPPAPRPAGHEFRTWLPGTEWETEVSIRASGHEGPVILVLGGVHGNEPGGYGAADEILGWELERGVLAVAPRMNAKAIATFERLIDGEGDLNRQFPGDRDSRLPTSRLAAEVTALASELRADLLLDLHESWAWYVDREAAGFVSRQQAGTAYLGQTITAGVGPLHATIAERLAAIVNAEIPREREHFIPREGRRFARSLPTSDPTTGWSSSSTLSLGGYVPGLTPVLVETAQQDLDLARRIELHLAVVRAAIEVMATA